MKTIILSLILFLIGFENKKSERIIYQEPETQKAAAPCFNLYSGGSTPNSDDIISIKLTNVTTGAFQTYWIGPSWSYGLVTSGAGIWCGTFNIEVMISIGGTGSVGIRDKNTGAVWSCQNVCCGEGQTVTFSNVPLSTPYGKSWEIYLILESC